MRKNPIVEHSEEQKKKMKIKDDEIILMNIAKNKLYNIAASN